MFLEYFNTEDTFFNLLEKRRYASAMSGLMKAFIDKDVYLQQKTKEKKFREEAEIVEKHKAYVLAKSSGFDVNPVSIAQPKSSQLKQSNTSIAGKYRSGVNLLDPNDVADKELIRNLTTPRSESHQYELVTDTKRPTETHCTNSSRVLPKYNLERIKQLAEQAESEAKASQARSHRFSKPNMASNRIYEEDGAQPSRRLSDARPQGITLAGHDDRATHQDGERSPGSPPREHSPSKLNMKRQEFKQRKSGQKSSSNSPEVQKEAALSDSEKKITFIEKMMNFDYSNLRKPRIETENEITSKLAKDALKRQKSREQRLEGLMSADEKSKSPVHQAGRQGRYGNAYSDEEMNVNNKKKDEYLLEYSDNEEDPLGFGANTFPKQKATQMRNSSPGYPPRSPDQHSVKSGRLSQTPVKGGEGNRASVQSKDKPEGKKLTPLVPESEKHDVYSKVQKQLNKKEKEQKAAQGILDKSREERTRTVSGGSRPPRERRYPQLDNKNLGYVPANMKEQKRFLAELDKPNYNSVKSSNYGKIEARKNGSKAGGRLD